MTCKVLILGASYGSLLGTKLLMAGHEVTLVCTAPTAELINREGTRVRFPVKGREGLVEVASTALPGRVSAAVPPDVEPAGFDLVVLGMQEVQYGADGVRDLMARVAAARIPCVAIMNMPPLSYLERIDGLDLAALEPCYANAAVWQAFDPARITLSSPDPQAFRPPEEPKNVLQVGLPTNFKVAGFPDAAPTRMLRELEAGIEAARFGLDGEQLEIPVKLKVHESPFVPLAKWPMLMTGNYRCVREEGSIPMCDAVHGDLERSQQMYAWVAGLCQELGAAAADLVPFEKYAQAAHALRRPSSAARALDAGARDIERVDCLVRRVAVQLGQHSDILDEIVGVVDARLERNRAAARAAAMSG